MDRSTAALFFIDREASEAQEEEDEEDEEGDASDAAADLAFIDDSERSNLQKNQESSAQASSSRDTHQKHAWVEDLAARFESGQCATLDRPPTPSPVNPSADQAYPISVPLSERVQADPYLAIVLLYCQPGYKAGVVARLQDIKIAEPDIGIHGVVPHPRLDGVFLVLDRDFNRQLGFMLEALPGCRRQNFVPYIMRTLRKPLPNPDYWYRFHIYISNVPNRTAFLQAIHMPSGPALLNRWVVIPRGLYEGDVGFVTRQYLPQQDEAAKAQQGKELSDLQAAAAVQKAEVADLWQAYNDASAGVVRQTSVAREVEPIESDHDVESRAQLKTISESLVALEKVEDSIARLQDRMSNPDPMCSVLVVPRLTSMDRDPPKADTSFPVEVNPMKRKRTSEDDVLLRASAHLARPWEFSREIKHQEGDVRVYKGLRSRTFEHDLEVLTLRSSVVRQGLTTYTPSKVLTDFLASEHPALDSIRSNPGEFLPLPQEWYFTYGDRCQDSLTKQVGIFTEQCRSLVSGIEMVTQEGVVSVPRLRLQKVVEVGDVVLAKLPDGSHVGPAFVVSTTEGSEHRVRQATIILHRLLKDLEDGGLDVEPHTLHVNCLRVVPWNWYDQGAKAKLVKPAETVTPTAPTNVRPLFAGIEGEGASARLVIPANPVNPIGDTEEEDEDPYKGRTGRAPWLNRKVYIACEGDAHNKEQAIVKDVLLMAEGKEWETTQRINEQTLKSRKAEYRNGIKIVVEFTMVRSIRAGARTYHYENVLDWNTRWPLRIACPLHKTQLAFSGPPDVRDAELRRGYARWRPEDLARRSIWYIADRIKPAVREKTPPREIGDSMFGPVVSLGFVPDAAHHDYLSSQHEEARLREFTRIMLENDPTIPRRVLYPPRLPKSRPELAESNHWIMNPVLKGFRLEVLYKEPEVEGTRTEYVYKRKKMYGGAKKRQAEHSDNAARIIVALGDDPNGPDLPRVVYRCSATSLRTQKERLIPDGCQPLRPGSKYGRHYRLYAFQGPHEGSFMRPISHQKLDDGSLVHSGTFVRPLVGGPDTMITDLGPNDLSIDDLAIRSLSTIRDEDAVLVKDTNDDKLWNKEYERMRAQELCNARL